MTEKDSISLYQLLARVKDAIYQEFHSDIWVVAEINSITRHRNGHVYVELIEKKDGSDKIVASAKGIIWANKAGFMLSYFEDTTGQTLTSGIRVLCKVGIEYNEIYGLSLIITDIDPSYTLGAWAQARLAVIKKLQDEGIFNLNKELELPMVVQRLAVITSETAAGWGDFKHQLQNNSRGIYFSTHLYSAYMQGEASPQSIAAAFDAIYEGIENYDVVVIIRGGGSKADLAYFDNYLIASYAAQFPIPVIAGIGHERDVSVLDLVAHTSLKTPTAVAEFLIERATLVYDNLMVYENNLQAYTQMILQEKQQQLLSAARQLADIPLKVIHTQQAMLSRIQMQIHSASKMFLQEKKELNLRNQQYVRQRSLVHLNTARFRLENLVTKLRHTSNIFITNQHNKLNQLQLTLEIFSPQNILKRGYAFVLLENKRISSASDVKQGQTLDIHFHDGVVHAKVESIRTDEMTE